MNETLNVVSLSQLIQAYPMLRSSELDQDFAITNQEVDETSRFFRHPFRFDGFVVAFCTEGELVVDLNLQTYVIRKNMLFLCEPGHIVMFHAPEKASVKTRFRVAVASTSFVHEVNEDISSRYSISREIHKDPRLSFSDSDADLINRYYDLAESMVGSHLPQIREALRFVAYSSIFILSSFWERKRMESDTNLPSTRSQDIVDRYINLVTEHHMEEHYLAFYARELDITPKYLSKLVRDITGRSAPDWIDSFLILEAKNMLKYSRMAIKEIVDKLHFPDQSSFYKFFKLHTGMIPSEYRKSR